MKRPRLYLFIGYPGAGKTTISQIIEAETGAVHIWADHERQKMFDQPTHSAAESRQLYTRLNDVAGRLLGEGKSVIFDTNFNFYKDRQHLREIASRHQAEAVVIWVTTDKALAKQRAVEDSHGRDTRLYGNMSGADFERIAGHLESPLEDENPIKIDGTNVDRQAVIDQLSL
jgi:predicted kinase